jgi:hypothetical protein
MTMDVSVLGPVSIFHFPFVISHLSLFCHLSFVTFSISH